MSNTKNTMDMSYIQKLTSQERNRLQELEIAIKSSLKGFYDVGCALAEIRDLRLYREDYKNFKDYYLSRWNMKGDYVYRVIAASAVCKNLNVYNCIQKPPTEFHVRPLTKLQPEQQVQAWRQAVKTAPGGKVTARHVKKVVNQITGEIKQEKQKGGDAYEDEVKNETPEGEVAMRFARMAVMQLKEIHHSHHDREQAFNYVQDWINKNR